MPRKTGEKHASKRLSEMLSILQKHHIIAGLTPIKLRQILEDLGPTYVKFGQLMSMRSDLIPSEYAHELEKLRTDVQPLSFDVVKKSIEESLNTPIHQVFSYIDSIPLGSASIAQVHKATLLNGEEVVIKIQRPHIYETMEADIKLLRKACSMMKIAAGTGDLLDFKAVINELWRTSQIEMDFIKEAENIDKFASFQKEVSYIKTPTVYHEYTSNKMLVMSNVHGIQLDNRVALDEAGYDRDDIARKIADNYCKQILEDGFFHADPHPGNIFVDKNKIAWIDFGMMGTLTLSTQRIIDKAVNAIIDDDIYDLEDAFLLLVKPEQEINQARLISQLNLIVDRYKETNFSEFDLGPLIEGCFNIIKSNQIAIPADLTMLARSMITIEGTLGKVSKKVNLIEVLADHMKKKLQQEFDLKTQLTQTAQILYTNTKKGISLPSMTHDILKLLKNGHLTTHIIQEPDMKTLREYRRNNHNITLAIIIGILFLSASLFSMGTLPPFMFGLPFISLAELLLGIILLIRLLHDLTKKI